MKKIPLTQGYVALVDDDDYPLVSSCKWYAMIDRHALNTKLIYVRTWIPNPGGNPRGRVISLHRLLMNVLDQPSIKVDHRNGNGLDNRRVNLRLASAEGNSRNRRHIPNKSGYKGVVRHGPDTYEARIRANHDRLYLGCYRTARDAALAYDDAARKYHGEFACLNFPQEQPDGADDVS